MQYVTAYIATAIAFFAIDLVWLSRIARRFYYDRLGHLLLRKPNIGAAAAFYAVFVVGIVFFAVVPALQTQDASRALLNGALFGFFAYSTYDMTNYATVKGWSLTVSVIDTIWGTGLTGLSALTGYVITAWLF